MTIPRQLLTYLNSGKCFALVGSGLSTALDYPSWWHMAKDAANLIPTTDPERAILDELIAEKDYPEVFQRVALNLGSVEALLTELRRTFGPKKDRGEAYEHVCRWPFRCYLTTNYDDEITNHLQRINEHFTTLGNSQADLGQITASSSRRAIKIHGDLSTPNDIVLTTSQYKEFETGGPRQYFRNKLISLFQMVPIVVLGHSMTDRDLQLVLQLAKESSAPENPIFMIVADAKPAEVEKLQREFNIRILSFPNPNGDYKNLLQTLRQIDRFVVPRTSNQVLPLDFPDAKEAEDAVGLYVHSSLGLGPSESLLHRIIQPQILSISAKSETGVLKADLTNLVRPNILGQSPTYQDELADAIESLRVAGHVTENETSVIATAEGAAIVSSIEGKRKSEEDQVFGAMRARLLSYGSKEDVELLVSGFKAALVTVFRKRGLSASELLFRKNQFEAADMPELFDAVFPPATAVEDFTLRAEYCNEVMDILTKPNEDQKNYLAHLAQGFFAYHMFGVDPSGQKIRTELAQGTVWILDSNIMLPLIARYSNQNDFMTGLIERLRNLGIQTITTPQLVSEVDRAWGWMANQLRNVPDGDEAEKLLRVTQLAGYSENPFVDSFIGGHVAGEWKGMSEYRLAIGHEDGIGFRDTIQSLGIEVIVQESIEEDDGTNQVDSLGTEIRSERERTGTLRGDGDAQASAEAETLFLIRCIREKGFRGNPSVNKSYFVSTSRILDNLFHKTDGLITWSPDTLYNHLAFMSGEDVDPDDVFRAITTTFYAAGVSVVDESTYRQYFKSSISESNAILAREVDNYSKLVSKNAKQRQESRESIQSQYSRTPDLEKPQFVTQLGWVAARKAEEGRKAAESARDEAEQRRKKEVSEVKGEYERKEKERKRHAAGKEKNLNDPKHQRKLKNQAKKRKRKRRK